MPIHKDLISNKLPSGTHLCCTVCWEDGEEGEMATTAVRHRDSSEEKEVDLCDFHARLVLSGMASIESMGG